MVNQSGLPATLGYAYACKKNENKIIVLTLESPAMEMRHERVIITNDCFTAPFAGAGTGNGLCAAT